MIASLVSGHTSTVWALSFNTAGDKMVTCRYAKVLFSGISVSN